MPLPSLTELEQDDGHQWVVRELCRSRPRALPFSSCGAAGVAPPPTPPPTLYLPELDLVHGCSHHGLLPLLPDSQHVYVRLACIFMASNYAGESQTVSLSLSPCSLQFLESGAEEAASGSRGEQREVSAASWRQLRVASSDCCADSGFVGRRQGCGVFRAAWVSSNRSSSDLRSCSMVQIN